MADGLPPHPGALKQIYKIAAERWRHWDSRRKRTDGTRRTGRGARAVQGVEEAAQAPRSGPPRPGSTVTAAERRRAQRLRQQGHSLRAISQMLSRPVSTVRRLVSDEQPGEAVSRAELRALDVRVTRIEQILAALGKVLQGLESDSMSRRRRQAS